MTLSRVTIIRRTPRQEQVASFEGATVAHADATYVVSDPDGNTIATFDANEFTATTTAVEK